MKKFSIFLALSLFLSFTVVDASLHFLNDYTNYDIPPFSFQSLSSSVKDTSLSFYENRNIRSSFPFDFDSLTEHDPIVILNDANFTDYAFPGTGDIGDPYRIEGYKIITNETYAIYIEFTTKHFVIQNCFLQSYDDFGYGIYMYTITNDTTLISNNVFNISYTGIEVEQSDSVSMSSNLFIGGFYGAYFSNSLSLTLTNNSFVDNEEGLFLWNSDGLVGNNTFSSFYIGMSFSTLYSLTIFNNTFVECGLVVPETEPDNFVNVNITDNIVNGKLLGYFFNQDDLMLTDPLYGQLILVNCTNATITNQTIFHTSIALQSIYSTNYTIYENTFASILVKDFVLYYSSDTTIFFNSFSFSKIAIRGQDSNNLTIYYNTFHNASDNAIYLVNCAYSLISDNVISFISQTAVYLSSSSFSIIANNTFTSNIKTSLHLQNSVASSVINNTMDYGERGIYIYSSSNTLLQDNYISNTLTGMDIASNYCNITLNRLYSNNKALLLNYNSNSSITSNIFYNSSTYAVDLSTNSVGHVLYSNYFIDNGGATSQALDDGTSNMWYNLSLLFGNYWSDWSGDGNYSIDGSANSFDLYPALPPDVIAPFISDIAFSPLIPYDDDTISISCTVYDNVMVDSVLLFYRIDSGSFVSLLMTGSSSLYNISIGPFDANSTISFYIFSNDTSSNSASSSTISFSISAYSPPVISNVTFTPEQPTDHDVVTVSCEITDFIGTVSVNLFVQIDGGSYIIVPMIANGSLYSLEFGPFLATMNVSFFVAAIDDTDLTSFSPTYSFIVLDATSPTISDVLYSPSPPRSTDEITISANITDNVEIASVFLFYRINNNTWLNMSMDSTDTIYSSVLGTFAATTTIEFFIEATDTSLNVATSDIVSFIVYEADTSLTNIDTGTLILIISSSLVFIGIVTAVIVTASKFRVKKYKRGQD